MFSTIKSKFIVFTVLFIILSAGIPTYFLLTQFKKNFQQRSEVMLRTTLRVVNEAIIQEMNLKEKPKDVQRIIDHIAENESIKHIRVLDDNGRIKYSTIAGESGKNIAKFDPHHLPAMKELNTDFNRIDKRSVFSTTIPLFNEKKCQSCHTQQDVIAFLDVDVKLTSAERAFYTGSLHIVILSLLVVIVLVVGFYFLFNHFINKPLRGFMLALDSIDSGNLDTQLPAKKQDEFGIIEGHFNRMVQNLKESRAKIDEMHFDQLQRADKLVTLGELAAEMAHEINNPAGIIMSRIEYLLLESEDNNNLANYNEDYEVILQQVNKVSNITGSILKYSKKLPKNIQTINLGELVANSIHILDSRIQKHNIQVRQDYSCNKSCDRARVLGDPQQIEQIIINILNNAIDSISNSGIIEIGIKCTKEGFIQLSIIDNGTGMSENVRSQIFSPFFTTKSAERGTGLGLYIVKKICDNHQAEIMCFSEEKKGTSFLITFLGMRQKQ